MGTIPKELASEDYFNAEFCRFREVMCSRNYTSEQKADALHGFMFVAFAAIENAPADRRQRIEDAFRATCNEYDRRLAYELFRP